MIQHFLYRDLPNLDKICSAITRQTSELESCSNSMKMRQAL